MEDCRGEVFFLAGFRPAERVAEERTRGVICKSSESRAIVLLPLPWKIALRRRFGWLSLACPVLERPFGQSS